MAATSTDEFAVEDKRKDSFGVVRMSDVDSNRYRRLTPAQRCVYVSLCLFAGRYTGKCYPKVKTLCRITGFSRATVFRALATLESAAFIERSKRFFSSARKVNLYTIL
jgi:DNA-binding MarR family transcriptional regulator